MGKYRYCIFKLSSLANFLKCFPKSANINCIFLNAELYMDSDTSIVFLLKFTGKFIAVSLESYFDEVEYLEH